MSTRFSHALNKERARIEARIAANGAQHMQHWRLHCRIRETLAAALNAAGYAFHHGHIYAQSVQNPADPHYVVNCDHHIPIDIGKALAAALPGLEVVSYTASTVAVRLPETLIHSLEEIVNAENTDNAHPTAESSPLSAGGEGPGVGSPLPAFKLRDRVRWSGRDVTVAALSAKNGKVKVCWQERNVTRYQWVSPTDLAPIDPPAALSSPRPEGEGPGGEGDLPPGQPEPVPAWASGQVAVTADEAAEIDDSDEDWDYILGGEDPDPQSPEGDGEIDDSDEELATLDDEDRALIARLEDEAADDLTDEPVNVTLTDSGKAAASTSFAIGDTVRLHPNRSGIITGSNQNLPAGAQGKILEVVSQGRMCRVGFGQLGVASIGRAWLIPVAQEPSASPADSSPLSAGGEGPGLGSLSSPDSSSPRPEGEGPGGEGAAASRFTLGQRVEIPRPNGQASRGEIVALSPTPAGLLLSVRLPGGLVETLDEANVKPLPPSPRLTVHQAWETWLKLSPIMRDWLTALHSGQQPQGFASATRGALTERKLVLLDPVEGKKRLVLTDAGRDLVEVIQRSSAVLEPPASPFLPSLRSGEGPGEGMQSLAADLQTEIDQLTADKLRADLELQRAQRRIADLERESRAPKPYNEIDMIRQENAALKQHLAALQQPASVPLCHQYDNRIETTPHTLAEYEKNGWEIVHMQFTTGEDGIQDQLSVVWRKPIQPQPAVSVEQADQALYTPAAGIPSPLVAHSASPRPEGEGPGGEGLSDPARLDRIYAARKETLGPRRAGETTFGGYARRQRGRAAPGLES